MTSQPAFIQPPRLATWLAALFMPVEEAESLQGDLLEEFSSLASERGVAFARNWYWRQVLKTIVHLAGTAFRTAPFLMAGAVAAGCLLIGIASRFSVQATHAFLESHRVYESHPDAYLFWIKFPLQTGRMVVCFLAGVLLALAARRRELIATLTLAVVEIAFFLSAVLVVIASGRAWLHWFLAMLPWNGLFSLAILTGGITVQRWRSAKGASLGRRSAAWKTLE